MQVTHTNTDGLKRTLHVVIPADEIGKRVAARLDELQDRVQLKGFRKGKVPVAHLRKVYGRSVMLEVLDQTVKDTSSKAIADTKERPALTPSIELTKDQAEIDRVLDGKADLAYSMSFEVLPEITVTDLSALKLERLSAEVDEAAIDAAIVDLRERSVTFKDADHAHGALEGDKVTLDYIGRIDGVAFDGGTGEGAALVLGKAKFIPGFEDGLKGAVTGEERGVHATFPADYPEAALAGKPAEFACKITGVARPELPEVNDEFAKTFGAESLANLRDMVKSQIGHGYAQAARLKLKRELLDALDKAHDFALPPTLVVSEYEAIWKQVQGNMVAEGKTFPHEGKSEDEAKAEYQKIAERRVRLGLVIGEIGAKHSIDVSQDELKRALQEQVRQFPGRERMFYEHYQKHPEAIAELRAPIFEDKVVDHVIEMAKPHERKVTKDELMKAVEAATEG